MNVHIMTSLLQERLMTTVTNTGEEVAASH